MCVAKYVIINISSVYNLTIGNVLNVYVCLLVWYIGKLRKPVDRLLLLHFLTNSILPTIIIYYYYIVGVGV